MSTHESFTRAETVAPGSNRAFGLVMAAAFGLIGAWQAWAGRSWGLGALAVAAAFLLAALAAPGVLAPLNRLWLRFGLLLHRVVNPVVMAVLFFGVVLPTGLLMRALGKRPLALGRDPARASYWERRAPGEAPARFHQQF